MSVSRTKSNEYRRREEAGLGLQLVVALVPQNGRVPELDGRFVGGEYHLALRRMMRLKIKKTPARMSAKPSVLHIRWRRIFCHALPLLPPR
jgi:hypothetical protein